MFCWRCIFLLFFFNLCSNMFHDSLITWVVWYVVFCALWVLCRSTARKKKTAGEMEWYIFNFVIMIMIMIMIIIIIIIILPLFVITTAIPIIVIFVIFIIITIIISPAGYRATPAAAASHFFSFRGKESGAKVEMPIASTSTLWFVMFFNPGF